MHLALSASPVGVGIHSDIATSKSKLETSLCRQLLYISDALCLSADNSRKPGLKLHF
jgi:hypothetical protein